MCPVWSAVNSVALNIHKPVGDLFSFFLGTFQGVEQTGHIKAYTYVFTKTAKLFSRVVALFYSNPLAAHGHFSFFKSLPTLLLFFSNIAIPVDSEDYSTTTLICIPLVTKQCLSIL